MTYQSYTSVILVYLYISWGFLANDNYMSINSIHVSGETLIKLAISYQSNVVFWALNTVLFTLLICSVICKPFIISVNVN